MWCDVMWCDVMWCDVMWCDVMWCDVMWCDVMWCDVTWRGVTWCHDVSLSPGVSIAASVLTIVALSLDRYVAVLHPVKSRSFSTKSHIRNTIFLIWAIACTIMLPLLAVQTVTLEILPSGHAFAYCYENWNSVYGRRIFDCFLFVFIYVVPGSVVIVSYSLTGRHLVVSRTLQRNNSLAGHSSRIMEGRRRVARMLLMLAALFAISWLPYHSTVIYMNFSGSGNGDSSMTVLSFALLLGHWHSAQNPVLYCITNANFWRATVAILKCRTLQKQGMQKVCCELYTTSRFLSMVLGIFYQMRIVRYKGRFKCTVYRFVCNWQR